MKTNFGASHRQSHARDHDVPGRLRRDREGVFAGTNPLARRFVFSLVVGTICAIVIIAPAVVWAGVGRLDLTWIDGSTNEDGFTVESHIGPCGAGTFGAIGTLGPNVTAFADTGLPPGATRCYRVRAFNAAGASAFSNEAVGTTTSAPGGPSGLTVQ